jgi:hypothetical protein
MIDRYPGLIVSLTVDGQIANGNLPEAVLLPHTFGSQRSDIFITCDEERSVLRLGSCLTVRQHAVELLRSADTFQLEIIITATILSNAHLVFSFLAARGS